MDLNPASVLKYCPRCGSDKFRTNDSGHSFRCEECHFHYFINNSAAVACLIFNERGQLMLARRAIEPNKGMLDLPGGFVEPNETAEAAVVREIFEELQVRVTKMKYLISFPNIYPFSGLNIFTLDLAFICEVDHIKNIIPGDDISGIEFVDPDGIEQDRLCSESMRKIIRYYITNNSK